jgi:hypothetical protein
MPGVLSAASTGVAHGISAIYMTRRRPSMERRLKVRTRDGRLPPLDLSERGIQNFQSDIRFLSADHERGNQPNDVLPAAEEQQPFLKATLHQAIRRLQKLFRETVR